MDFVPFQARFHNNIIVESLPCKYFPSSPCPSFISLIWQTLTLHEHIYLFTLYLYLTLLERITIRQNSSTINWCLPPPNTFNVLDTYVKYSDNFFLLVNLRTNIHSFIHETPWTFLLGHHGFCLLSCWHLLFDLTNIQVFFYFFQPFWTFLSSLHSLTLSFKRRLCDADIQMFISSPFLSPEPRIPIIKYHLAVH